jgi:hypothetical protein
VGFGCRDQDARWRGATEVTAHHIKDVIWQLKPDEKELNASRFVGLR